METDAEQQVTVCRKIRNPKNAAGKQQQTARTNWAGNQIQKNSRVEKTWDRQCFVARVLGVVYCAVRLCGWVRMCAHVRTCTCTYVHVCFLSSAVLIWIRSPGPAGLQEGLT